MIRTGMHNPSFHVGAWNNVKQIADMWDADEWNHQRCDVHIAAKLLLCMIKRSGQNAPNDVYPDGDGNEIVFEWRYPDDRISRLWIQGLCCGELMTTYGDGKPTEWRNMTWGDGKITVAERT